MAQRPSSAGSPILKAQTFRSSRARARLSARSRFWPKRRCRRDPSPERGRVAERSEAGWGRARDGEYTHPLVMTGGGGSGGGALPLPLPIPAQPVRPSSAISATAVTANFFMHATPTTYASQGARFVVNRLCIGRAFATSLPSTLRQQGRLALELLPAVLS